MSGNVTTNMVSVYQNTTLYDTFLMTHGNVYDFQKMACIDWDDVEVEHSLAPRAYTSWNALNILRLTLAMWIMGSHVAIIVFVLAMRGLRSQPKNLLIVNVALTNLLMGAFVVPVKLHFILNPDVMACDLAIGWTFISDYFQTSVSLFAVFSLVLERFIYVFTEKKQIYVKPWASRLITVVLLVSPWLLAAILLVPTFYGGMLAKSHDGDNCLFKVNENYFVAAQLLSFIPASLAVFVAAPYTGLLDCLRPNRCFYTPLTPKGESVTVTAFVSLCSIFAEAPFCIVRVLLMKMECDNSVCVGLVHALTMTVWVRLCKTAVMPFIWLAYTDIRNAMLCQLSFGDDTNDDEDEDDFEEPEQVDDTQKLPLKSILRNTVPKTEEKT